MARHHADPGELKHRVDMYRLDQQPDGLGEMSTNHLFVASVWARVQPLSADRDEQGEQIMETVQHRITIRFRDDVASGWRLHLGERVFDILTVFDPTEAGRFLECRCQEQGR